MKETAEMDLDDWLYVVQSHVVQSDPKNVDSATCGFNEVTAAAAALGFDGYCAVYGT